MSEPRRSRLRDEIKQRRPFRSLEHETVLNLLRTAALVSRDHQRVVESSGVSGEQYNVLRILRGAGNEGIPTLEVAARMVVPTPGITRLLDKLEAKKLARRVRCPEDRRQVLCWITPAGLELLASLDTPVDHAAVAAMSALRREELVRLVDLLEKVRSAHD